MRICNKKALAAIMLCSAMQASNADQVVSSDISLSDNSVHITPIYHVTEPQNGNETGLGLRLHFNSSELQFVQATNLYLPSSLGISGVQDDTENWDQDESTDKVIITSWMDISSQWPGENNLPLNLYTAEFSKKAGFSGDANIRFSSSSHDANSQFRAESDNTPPADDNALNVPTLSEWLMILLSLGLFGLALMHHRKEENKK